jgi:hypothetical protein
MLINYECNNPECTNSIVKSYKNYTDIENFLDCGECGIGKLERVLGAPASKTSIVIDNGVSPKQVEVSSEVVLNEENKARFK